MLLLPVIVATAALSGSAGAGMYVPPPGDAGPQWLPNGLLAYVGFQPYGSSALKIIDADGSGQEQVVVSGVRSYAGVLAAPTEPLLAFVAERAGAGWLAVAAADGSQLTLLFEEGTPVGWQPDSSRLLFSDFDSRVYSIRPDGTDLTAYHPNVRGVPSPDGTRFAYAIGDDSPKVHVVNADGTGDVRVTTGGRFSEVTPVWSPDGSRLAFWSSDGKTARLIVTRIGGSPRAFTIAGAFTNGSIVWSPDGGTIFAQGRDGLVGFDLTAGKRRTLVGIPDAVFSPDGARIAYATGGECRDRVGVHVAQADGTGRRRVSNSCRIVGTQGPDVLRGAPSQVLLGLEGNDTLHAGYAYYFQGNTLFGGVGDDRLVGNYSRDTLYGGPGDDSLLGGPSADTLIGGPGRDRISGQGGGDTIGARDGRRDSVSCGKNAYGRAGRDTVYADRVDIVAADCEIVRRH